MNAISANDLKTNGLSIAKKLFAEGEEEAIITVRGKAQFVLIPVESYDEYREMKLFVALQAANKCVEEGDFHEETADEHIKRITK